MGALALVAVSLPRETIRLTASPAGQALRSRLEERRWGMARNRFAQGVLILPPTGGAYRRGRRMQAARTNVSRARSIGLTCEPISFDDRPAAVESYRATCAREGVDPDPDPEMSPGWWRELLSRDQVEWWAARDGGGETVGLAVLSVDEQAALLWVLLSIHWPARWLLNVTIAERLSDAGVRHVIVDAHNALSLDPGLQELQRRLGYSVANLAIAECPVDRAGRERLPPSRDSLSVPVRG